MMHSYLFDENISHRLAAHLKDLGVDVDSVGGAVAKGVDDEDVIHCAHQQGRILVTYDRTMFSAHSVALASTNICVLYLPGEHGNLTRWDRTLWFLTHMRDIDEQITKLGHGQYEVSVTGKLVLKKPLTITTR